MKKALAYLAQSHTDTSHHDISKPETIQRTKYGVQEGWRITYGFKPPEQREGGQLVVTVWDAGKIDVWHAY